MMPSTSLSTEVRGLTRADKTAEDAGNIGRASAAIGMITAQLSKKCTNCNREVESNEKFCLECGAKL